MLPEDVAKKNNIQAKLVLRNLFGNNNSELFYPGF
jgi:hypothetical protein